MIGQYRGYEFHLERGDLNYRVLEPLYRQHYGEMQARLAKDGIEVSEYRPDLARYFRYFATGGLLNFVVRIDGKAVGYSNVYVTNDMHNGELIAQEDTIYVHPDHRKGVGRALVQAILGHLKTLGVRRVLISPVTDLRVGKIWARMGFKEAATQMVYQFQEPRHVRTDPA